MSYYIANTIEYLWEMWKKMSGKDKSRRKEAWDMDCHRFDGVDPDDEEAANGEKGQKIDQH